MRTFMFARLRGSVLEALTSAARQRRIIVKAFFQAQRDRFALWIDLFGEQATRPTGSTASLILSGSSMPTSSFSQPTQPTGSSGAQVKAMAWQFGDACTASTA